jgi:hypothetical protein
MNSVWTLPISRAMRKPIGIIVLFNEAWYGAQHYKLSSFVTDWQISDFRFQIAPHRKKISCVDIPVFQTNPNCSRPQNLHTVPEGQEESYFLAFHPSPSSPLRERGGPKKGGSVDIHPKSI